MFMIVNDCSCITHYYALIWFVMLCLCSTLRHTLCGHICVSLSRGRRRSQARQTETPDPWDELLNTASFMFEASSHASTIVRLSFNYHYPFWSCINSKGTPCEFVKPRSERWFKTVKLAITTHPNLHAFRFCLRHTSNINQYAFLIFLSLPSHFSRAKWLA